MLDRLAIRYSLAAVSMMALPLLGACAGPPVVITPPLRPVPESSTPSTPSTEPTPVCGGLTDLIPITHANALALASLPNGEILVGGYFGDGAQLGNNPDATLSRNGGTDGYVVRFDRSGEALWWSIHDSTRSGVVTDVAATDDGGFVALGEYLNNLTIEATSLPDVVGTGDDVYAVRYDAAGQVVWFQIFGGDGFQVAKGLSVRDDQTFVVGDYGYRGMVLSPGTPEETVYDNMDLRDLSFLASIGPDGVLDWSTTTETTQFTNVMGVAALPDGGVSWGGRFSTDITLAPGTPEETIYAPPQPVNSQHPWVAAHDRDGALIWSESPWGEANDFPRDFFAGVDGPILQGQNGDNARFGRGQAGATKVKERGSYVAAWRSDGQLEQVMVPSVQGGYGPKRAVQRADGTVLIGGNVGDSVGDGEDEVLVESGPGLILWSGEGQPICVWQMTTYSDEVSIGGVVLDNDGGAWMAVNFDEQITIGPGEDWERTVVSQGGVEAFVVRFQLP